MWNNQGDGNKAIFYYIADERVDFRQLIKVLADAFHVRIEMKQIGARQEAGRIGGIGPCGRELCCATWMTSFVSVSTSAARYQDYFTEPAKACRTMRQTEMLPQLRSGLLRRSTKTPAFQRNRIGN